MTQFFGVWKLDEPMFCKKEISGEVFQSRIANVEVSFKFPVCPEEYVGGVNPLDKGDLLAPLNIFQGKVNWGMIHEWPECLFSVNAIVVCFLGEEEDAQRVYEEFPSWKEKIKNLLMIDSGDFVEPKPKTVALLQNGNGIYDGLELFANQGSIQRVINNRKLEPISCNFVRKEQCYDKEKMRLLFSRAGDTNDITISYELLIVAYRAVQRYDFRSAIVLGGTALEKSILHTIKQYYVSNQMATYERDKKKHKALGGKFAWLKELNISIPITDYSTKILDFRNPTAHEGINQSYENTMAYLNNCKALIKVYCPNILED